MSEELKQRAAAAAIEYVEHGMRLGLGTGSTASAFVTLLGERVAQGLAVACVATSEATEQLARRFAVPMTTLDETPRLDLTVDGADEIGPGLALIKGGGGALLREKIVAMASARLIIIADAGKQVPVLGAFALPIEVVTFGLSATLLAIEEAGAALGLSGTLKIRAREGARYRTDGGNLIVDASFGRIPDPQKLSDRLARIPGVVEHGLFINCADLALIASADGVTRLRA